MQKESVLDTTNEDTTNEDTTKLDLTSLIPRIYSILTKEELDIIRKIIAKIEVKK